jgi:large repetitive protein
MKIIKVSILLLFLSVLFKNSFAQPMCTGPGQIPTNPYPACISSSLSPTLITDCTNGLVIVPTICLNEPGAPDYQAVRPYWYSFTCYQAGLLSFSITPINTNTTTGDDYDWQLYDVTGLSQAQIATQVFTNVNLIISANWAGIPGAITGASTAGTTPFVCATNGTGNAFSTRPNLILNHNYLLLISNFSPSQQGYSLVFGTTGATIVNPLQPALLNASAICGNTEVRIKTNKKMLCNSLALNGSDFVIIPPVGANINPISAAAVDCGNGKFNFDSLSVFVSTPLAPGTYTIRSKFGTDGNTLKDDCENQIPVSAELQFTVVPIPPAPTVISPVTYCQNVPATPLTATGTNLLWYTTATGGIGLTTLTPPTTNTGSTIYYVSQTISNCQSTRAAITVVVNPTPTAPNANSPIAYCQNEAATALTTLTGSNLLWYTTATGGVGSTSAPTPLTTTGGTTTYYVSQTLLNCESPRKAIVVNVTATPAFPTVTTPITYCQGKPTVALTATGTNLLWYTASTGGSGNTTAPIPSSTNSGSTIYYVSQSVNNCEGPRAAITVNITALPTAPIIVTPVTYCQTEIATALTATGTSLLWYTTATGGTGSTTAPTPNTINAGTIIYYVSQTVNGCEGPRAALSVVVNPTPAAPTANSPIAYCQNATATALTTLTGSNLLWYTTATGGVGSTTAPTPLTTNGGTVTYYVSQTLLNCESLRKAIVVNVTATPALPTVTTPITYCQGVTANALTATGVNLLWYTTATGGTGSTTAPIPSTTSTGNTIYYVSQSINNCEGPRAAITVTVNITPAAPTVTTPVVYCQGNTAAALAATGTSLLWYTLATGGTGSTTAPTPSTTTVGNTIYYVSQTTGICEGSRAAITVTVNSTPPAPTAPNTVPYCQGAATVQLTATGTNLLWYTSATGGVGSTTAPTPSSAVANTVSYYVSQTTGICEGPRKMINVVVTAIPAAPAVNNTISYCQGISATALTATGTNLLWYTSPTGGAGTTTAPIPNTTATGNTIYYVSQSVNNCEGPRAAITVTVNITPAAPTVTTPVVYCQSFPTVPLIANGTNLLWYTTATGGTGSTTTPTPSSISAGTTTFYVSQTTGTCEGPRSAIIVTVNATPALPVATTPITYCQGAIASTLIANGTNLLWYANATGGVGSTTAPTPSTAVGGSSTTYYVSQTILGCEGPRKAIIVNVTTTPVAPIVQSPITYCQNKTATALTANGTNLLWYTTPTGGTGTTTAPTPSTTNVGSTIYYVSQSTSVTNGACEGPRAAITVVVNITPAAPITISPKIYCQNAIATPLTASGTNLLWYTTATGGTGLVAAPIPATNIATNTNYYVTQSTAGCESPRALLSVNITATPAAPTVISPVQYCPGDPTIPLTSNATGTNLLWYTTAIGGVGSTTAPTPSSANTGTVSYYVSQSTSIASGGCEGPRAEIKVIVINNALTVSILPTDSTICEGKTIRIVPNVVPEATSYEWRAVGVPNSTIDNRFTKIATVSPVDTCTYILKATLGGCSTEAQMKVNVIWKPIIDAGLPKAICMDSSIFLKGIVTRKSSDSIDYIWSSAPVIDTSIASPNNISTFASPKISTRYTITYKTKPTYGCDFSESSTVKIAVQPIVKAFAGNDTIAVKGAPHKLHGEGGLNYTWSSPTGLSITNASSQNAFVTLNNDANFKLKVTDGVGCVGFDEIFIKVYEGPKYYIPNSFTPNGDGLNDIFRVIPAGIANTVYFRVFNRWGEILFETNQWLKGWDGSFKGKPQPNGTYVWMIKGTDKDNKKIELSGTVLLIR